MRFRYLKFESPLGGWGNVAELEFYSGDRKIQGEPFGTAGSRDQRGNDFSKALDGNVETFFDGVEPNNQYVGIDLGPQVQAAAPSSRPGRVRIPPRSRSRSPRPRRGRRSAWPATGAHKAGSGPWSKETIKVEKGAVLVAVAYTDRTGRQPAGHCPVPNRPGARREDGPHLPHRQQPDGHGRRLAATRGGKCRTDAGFSPFHDSRWPTDWLWNHPGGGFGDCRYAEAFFVLAPIDHIFTQPFHGHDRSIPNEVEYSGKFFDLCRKHSPDVQAWLYVQWPGPQFQDRWSQGKGATAELNLRPAKTWQEGVANHVAYTEAVAERLNKTYRASRCGSSPGHRLAMLKTEVDAGRVPGMKDFFAEIFADGIHLTPKGRY